MTNRTRFIINRLIDEMSNNWFTQNDLNLFFKDLGENISITTMQKYLEMEQVITDEFVPEYRGVRMIKGEDYDVFYNQMYFKRHIKYFINGLKARV